MEGAVVDALSSSRESDPHDVLEDRVSECMRHQRSLD